MTFIIDRITLENFGAFQEAVLDLSTPGLTMIEGVNGMGKSTLIEAVSWVLFTRTLREKWGGDDLIKHGAKYAAATVHITRGADQIIVSRFRKHPEYKNNVYVWINDADVTAGTNEETDRLITVTLGMDFTAFTNSVAYGAREDVKSFFAAPDSVRKDILENLLSLHVFSRAEDAAKARSVVCRKTLEDADQRLTSATATLELRQAVLAEAKNKSASNPEAELAHTAVSVATAQTQQVADLKSLDRHKQSQKDAQELFSQDLAAYEKAASAVDAEASKMLVAKTQCQTRIQAAQTELNKLNARIKAVASLATCPTCSQPVTAKHKAHVSDSVKEQAATLTHSISANELELAALNADPVPKKPMRPGEPPVLATARVKIAELAAQMRSREASIEALLQQAIKLKKVIAEQERVLANYEAQVAEAQEAMDAAILDRSVAAQAKELVDFWVHGFGNSGIKSFVIEAELAALNLAAATYAQRLIGPGAKVWLTATKELKSKKGMREEITVNGFIPGKANSYYAASKGQKRRLDICLLLAFRDFVTTRNAYGCPQLFIDEVFDGLDAEGCDTMVDLLREISNKAPVILLTHSDGLRRAATRSALVTHNGKTASLKVHN